MTKQELIEYAASYYSVEPDYPWPGFDYYVLRHRDSRKWFAVEMTVPYRKLGMDRDGHVDIVDVKCGPLLMGSYRELPGVLPGYHMNKVHWVTLLLDGGTEDSLIKELLDISYELTAARRNTATEDRGKIT